ncbi:MAG: hypothetical protein BRD42_01325 [Bacteroidetes bacterium QS_3_64_15]|nr:MAG: hypothetical protein BRD42_01325 [Bacteroidetes bacterium QS_3_64_15]
MTPRQQSILVGAVVTGILGTSYLGLINTICCLGVIVGGVVAAQQYAGAVSSMKTADGVYVGALAGAGGAILSGLLNRALRPIGLDSQSITQGMMEGMMQNMEGQQPFSPEMMAQQGNGGLLLFLGGLAFTLVLYAIFGAIGGAIGAAIFGGDGSSQSGGVQEAEAEIVE